MTLLLVSSLIGHRPRSEPALEKLQGRGGAESLGSGSCCSTPPGSSCYSSQRSSPAPTSTSNQADSPLRPSITRSLSHLLLEEDEEEPETNVDTGFSVSPHSDTTVTPMTRSSSMELLRTVHSERPAVVGASAVEGLAKDLSGCLPQTYIHPHTTSRMWRSSGCTNEAKNGQRPWKGPLVEKDRTIAGPCSKPLPSHTNNEEPVDEFFI